MKNYLILILALPLLFFGCKEDSDNTTIDVVYQPSEVIVTANLSGRVIDEYGQGVAEVKVVVEELIATTDDNGFYQFREISLNKRGAYITAHRGGFFPGSDRLYPSSLSTNFSTIVLLSMSFLICEGIDINLYAVDMDNQQETEAITSTIAVGKDQNLGQLQACDNPISEYLNSTIDGVQYNLPILSFGPDTLTLGGRYYVQGRARS